jgi:hypothetical protein
MKKNGRVYIRGLEVVLGRRCSRRQVADNKGAPSPGQIYTVILGDIMDEILPLGA